MFKDKDPTKELIVPWKHSSKYSKLSYEDAMVIARRKTECMLAHGVLIITSVDCVKYHDYVNAKYGKGYLKSFRYHKPA